MGRSAERLFAGVAMGVKRTTFVLLVAVMAGAAAPAAHAGYSALVIDTTNGNVLYQRDADVRRYPASLTKIMTLYMVFDALQAGTITMDTEWTVSAHAASQPPSKIGLPAGSTIKVRDAIMVLITKSANDIAAVVAEGMAGTESEFARLMTVRAREIGMRDTTFANASGLPNESMMSTARDMSVLAIRLQMDFPEYYPLFATRSYSYRGQTYGNHNKLLGVVNGVDGIKTGFTNAAGWNLVASAVRDGRRIVAVIMGGQSRIWRDNRMTELLGEGFVIAAQFDSPAPLPAEHPTRGSGEVMLASVEASDVMDTQHEDLAIDLAAFDNDAQDTASLMNAQGSVEDLPWAVQVGAFAQFANAYRALDEAEAVLGGLLGGKGTTVVTTAENDGETLYRARFVNLSESLARESCKALVARNLTCAVIRYSTGG